MGLGGWLLWAGIPARKIADRFDATTRESLTQAAWRDLPLKQIQDLAPLLMSADTEALLQAVEALHAPGSA